jgi:hypothetical protein
MMQAINMEFILSSVCMPKFHFCRITATLKNLQKKKKKRANKLHIPSYILNGKITKPL